MYQNIYICRQSINPCFQAYTNEVNFILTALSLFFAGYAVWDESQRRGNSPKILIDHEFEGGLIYLEVRNIGNDYARNVEIRFDPNIEYDFGEGVGKINDLNFFKNIPQLQPNRGVRMAFWVFL